MINERRREPRLAQATLRSGQPPQVPGARVIEVLDSSPRGLRCRLANPVRPGRAMSLRVADAGGAFALVTATVCALRGLPPHPARRAVRSGVGASSVHDPDE